MSDHVRIKMAKATDPKAKRLDNNKSGHSLDSTSRVLFLKGLNNRLLNPHKIYIKGLRDHYCEMLNIEVQVRIQNGVDGVLGNLNCLLSSMILRELNDTYTLIILRLNLINKNYSDIRLDSSLKKRQ